jgi:hypothetical protein
MTTVHPLPGIIAIGRHITVSHEDQLHHLSIMLSTVFVLNDYFLHLKVP